MIKIAILGTRGIPASYSGFETSVQETATRLHSLGYSVTVYCRSNHYQQKMNSFNGVRLRYSRSINSKHLDTVTATFHSVLTLSYMKYDVVLLYGVGNAYFIPLIRMFCPKIISVVDGADWERDKWGKFAKQVLSMGRYFAIKYATKIVVDNELMAQRYSQKYNIKPAYIAYGANKSGDYSKEILDTYQLKPGNYVIFVGRFVKEKGIEFLIENFKRNGSDIKLVIVGGNDAEPDYQESIRSMGNENIIFPGFLYGRDYESLLKYAKFYVSCSFLEGTSPSLLSAMAINGFALVSDLSENLEVLKGSCATFKTGDSEDFSRKFASLMSATDLEQERIITNKIVERYYNWDSIASQYSDLICEL